MIFKLPKSGVVDFPLNFLLFGRTLEAGSRLFFAEFRDRNRREKWAALEDQAPTLSYHLLCVAFI